MANCEKIETTCFFSYIQNFVVSRIFTVSPLAVGALFEDQELLQREHEKQSSHCFS